MSLGRRIWTVIPAALVVLALVAAPTAPAFASGEDTQSADKAKKAKKTETPAKAPDGKASAKAGDGAECKPTAKVNTFEDLYGSRNWLLRAAAPAAPTETTIVWRDETQVKSGTATKPAAKPTAKKEKKD